jgi:hypothetical protein
MKISFLALSLTMTSLFATGALAASELQKACSNEIKQYCNGAKEDKDIFECVEKREHMGKKKSGLSSECYEAHERYEEKMGHHEEDQRHE